MAWGSLPTLFEKNQWNQQVTHIALQVKPASRAQNWRDRGLLVLFWVFLDGFLGISNHAVIELTWSADSIWLYNYFLEAFQQVLQIWHCLTSLLDLVFLYKGWISVWVPVWSSNDPDNALKTLTSYSWQYRARLDVDRNVVPSNKGYLYGHTITRAPMNWRRKPVVRIHKPHFARLDCRSKTCTLGNLRSGFLYSSLSRSPTGASSAASLKISSSLLTAVLASRAVPKKLTNRPPNHTIDHIYVPPT